MGSKPTNFFKNFGIKAFINSNVFVGTTLNDVYTKCSLIKDVNQVFQSMQKISPITWSSMVAGYVLNRLYEDVLLLFHSSQLMGLELDQFMVSSTISAYAGLSTLIEGNFDLKDLYEAVIVGPSESNDKANFVYSCSGGSLDFRVDDFVHFGLDYFPFDDPDNDEL